MKSAILCHGVTSQYYAQNELTLEEEHKKQQQKNSERPLADDNRVVTPTPSPSKNKIDKT